MRIPFWRGIRIPLFIIVFLVSCLGPGGFVRADTVSEQKAALERQLKDIEAQIAQYQNDLTKIGSQKNTLQNKINTLKKQQATLVLQIKEASLRVEKASEQLATTQDLIKQNTATLFELKSQLTELIWELHDIESQSLLMMLLSNKTLSEFFAREQHYFEILTRLHTVTNAAEKVQKDLTRQEKEFEEQQQEAANYLSIKQIAQQKLVSSLGQQSSLLKETKGQETLYQAQLKEAAKQAAAIRGRLYQLLETSKQITFGEAATIADWVSKQTGVRSAFLLAVLTQESSLGRNVGTCNRKGDPASKSWKVVMKPERDHKPFLAITSSLGLDPDVTPVSCPMRDKNGKQLGWGGAMGPAQFIPSTWVGYQSKIANMTGKSVANPWDIKDAFVAAAIKLKADGAGTQEGEWAAAMRYFSGSTNPAYRFYGDNVVATAAQYQKDLDQIK